MQQEEIIETQSHWDNGRKKFEQIDLPVYKAFISRYYTRKGVCSEENVHLYGNYTGVATIHKKESKTTGMFSLKEGFTNGVVILMNTRKQK